MLLLVAAAVPLLSEPRADPPVLRAMQEELARSMSGLTIKDQPAPYYIAYNVLDATESRLVATLGAPVNDLVARMRLLRVDVRVGDYGFDSSRLLSFDRDAGLLGMLGLSVSPLPVDDDETVMRRQIWLATDAAYKRSVQILAKKKAAAQNRTDSDPIPDFSREKPLERVEPVAIAQPVDQGWADTVRRASAIFQGAADVVSSDAQLSVSEGTRYFVSSEGFRTVLPARSASFRVNAEVLADDGMALHDSVQVIAQSPRDLPPAADLLARTRRMLEDLRATRAGRVGDDYSGPVLVENEAAASLVAQSLVPLFLSQRAPESDDARMGSLSQLFSTPFLTRIGTRVMPESFTVRDAPSVQRFGAEPVAGAYAVDDEGLAAEDVTLVRDGRLLTMLTSRTPQKNLLQSNGHGRKGGAQAGVLLVESATAIPAAGLKAKYLDLLKTQGRTHGYILRRLETSTARPGDRQGPAIVRAVKVTPDGKEEAVRGLALGNIPHTAFRDILGASQERVLFNYQGQSPASMLGGAMVMPGATTLVSVIAPSLIFEELDLQKNKQPLPKKPIVNSPIK
jgi:hypothetical protein